MGLTCTDLHTGRFSGHQCRSIIITRLDFKEGFSLKGLRLAQTKKFDWLSLKIRFSLTRPI